MFRELLEHLIVENSHNNHCHLHQKSVSIYLNVGVVVAGTVIIISLLHHNNSKYKELFS